MELSGKLHALAALPPAEEPPVPIGCVSPKASLDAVKWGEISCPCLGIEPRPSIL
jgi:hypothetical protein